MADRTALYRHFAADGTLLYVGISNDYWRRLLQHDAASAWFWRVARVDVEHYGTRHAALSAERRAIQGEGPVYNAAHPGPEATLQPDMFQLLRLKIYWHGPFKRSAVIEQAKDIMGFAVSAHMLNRLLGPRRVDLRQRLKDDDTPDAMAELSARVGQMG